MIIYLKRNETLSWSVVDTAFDVTGVEIEAALEKDGFYYPLTVTEDDLSVGRYFISAEDTSDFPIGTMNCDIKYTVAGIVTYTDTFYVEVIERVTA
jgi:ethanolamine utilization protein EutP (predicted NTPase)